MLYIAPLVTTREEMKEKREYFCCICDCPLTEKWRRTDLYGCKKEWRELEGDIGRIIGKEAVWYGHLCKFCEDDIRLNISSKPKECGEIAILKRPKRKFRSEDIDYSIKHIDNTNYDDGKGHSEEDYQYSYELRNLRNSLENLSDERQKEDKRKPRKRRYRTLR